MDLEITKTPLIVLSKEGQATIQVPSASNGSLLLENGNRLALESGGVLLTEDDGTVMTTGIASGTLNLKRSIVDTDIDFGTPIASEFSVELFNIDTDLQGYTIQVYLKDTQTNALTPIFTGIVDSSKTDNVGHTRQIVAYDWIYYHRNDNVADWWNALPRTIQNIKTVRNSLLTYLGFTVPSAEYVNDYAGGLSWTSETFPIMTTITFNQVIKMLCELQGTFPYIDAAGNLTFATLDNNTTTDLRGEYESYNSTWEDFVTEPITGIASYSSSDDLLMMVGTDDNVYNIAGNLWFIYLIEEFQSAAQEVLEDLLDAIDGIQYKPCQLKMIKAHNGLVLGQRVQTDKGYSYVMSEELSGVCFVEQTIEAKASASKLSGEVNDINDTMVQGHKMSKVEKTIDGISTQVSNVETNLQNNYYTKSATESRLQQTSTQIVTYVGETFTSQADAIKTDTLHYLATSAGSGVTKDTPGWTTTVQTMTPTNKYLWTYHTYTYANGSSSDTNPVITGTYGEAGPPGNSKVYSFSSNNGQWIKTDTQVSGKTVYKSDSNYHVHNGESRCKITFNGYDTFTIMACSDGEQNYDYLEVSNLDATTITRNGSNYFSFKTVTTSSTNYQAITFSNLDGGEHSILLLYSKDSSADANTDRAYFYIPEGVGADEGIGVISVTPLYYCSNSSTAPAKPTSEVTSTSTSTGAWTKAIPTVSTSYSYLYTCDQVKYTNGQFTWSDVVSDTSTSTAFSEINQMKDKIVLKVDNNGKIVKAALSADPSTGSTFQIDADYIYFKANKTIDLATGNIAVSANNFSIDNSGNVTLTGTIHANGGDIGGWTIRSSGLSYGMTSDTDYTHAGIFLGSSSQGIITNYPAYHTHNELNRAGFFIDNHSVNPTQHVVAIATANGGALGYADFLATTGGHHCVIDATGVSVNGANTISNAEVKVINNNGDRKMSTGFIDSNWTGNRVVYADNYQKLVTSNVTNAELEYLSGVTGYIQTQLNNKASASDLTTLQSYLCHSGLRFKNLGTSFTSAQAMAIANGDFSDLWNGDYWQDTTQGITWRIVDNTNFMFYRGTGTSKGQIGYSHLIIMPDLPISSGWINSSQTISNGYGGCNYRSASRSGLKTKFTNFFGTSHIKTYTDSLTSAGSDARADYDCDVELPQISNLFGYTPAINSNYVQIYNAGITYGRFRLFSLAPYYAYTPDYDVWVRDIESTTNWCILYKSGLLSWRSGASSAYYRPFAILA